MGPARSALTKISSSKPPTVTELKTTWSAVSLQDFPYNIISAKQLEKVLHQKLQHRLRGQKLWIYNGKGGGNPTSTNVSMCYGPMTGLVRNPDCNNVSWCCVSLGVNNINCPKKNIRLETRGRTRTACTAEGTCRRELNG